MGSPLLTQVPGAFTGDAETRAAGVRITVAAGERSADRAEDAAAAAFPIQHLLIRQHKAKDAEQMLGHLSELLRGVLEDVDAQEVPLRRELEYLRLYLAIEQVRFPDRPRVEITVDPATHEASVPQLVLQPIVENAIRHGIGRSLSAGHIQISAAKTHDAVELRVQDDGPGFSPGDASGDRGIGLTNTRARLQQIHGRDAKLEIENCDLGGVIVTMSIPFRHSRAEL